MEARFCEKCGSVTESPQLVGGHYYCSRCAAEMKGQHPSPASAPLRDSAAPVGEKLKFRCTGCGALLSSKRVKRKSRLRCPQCQTELFLNPDGSVEPVIKVKQQPRLSERAPSPQTGFSREELEQMLDLSGRPRGGAEDTSAESGPRESTAPPPPPPAQKRPARPVPKMRVTRSAIMEKYRKMAESIQTGESKALLGLAAVLLILPALFLILVVHNVEGLGEVKGRFAGLAKDFGEAAKRLRGLTPEQPPEAGTQKKEPQKQPPAEETPKETGKVETPKERGPAKKEPQPTPKEKQPQPEKQPREPQKPSEKPPEKTPEKTPEAKPSETPPQEGGGRQ